MHTVDGHLLLSPTDLVGFLACKHLTQRERAAAHGSATRPDRTDPELELLAAKGGEHELAQRDRLRLEHGAVVDIDDRPETISGLRAAEASTLAAMRAGAPVIYQATFLEGRWRGRADFLLRVEAPSELGAWSYEVADAKLARSVRVGALLQMCEYSLHVRRLQGRTPERVHVLLGSGRRETHRVADYDAYHRAARARLERAVDASARPTYPHPVAHCGVCAWLPECERRRRDDDHLCLVAGMRRDQTRRLVEAGIGTVAALAAAPAKPVGRVGEVAWRRLRHQASLQVAERAGGSPVYELVDCGAPDLGLGALPEPSAGDVFFDMEGDPYVADGGLEYLFGLTEVVDGAPRFRPEWGHDRAGEKAAFERVVDTLLERHERDPSMHVYHYAAYEPSALKRLMGRHATREEEVDRLLRAGVLVDLYQVVRQGVRVSREAYSLKQLEAFFMPPRAETIADAAGSIVAYERWRETHDDTVLAAIAAYNERDCESTLRLRDWLEGLREEWRAAHGRPLPRRTARSGDPTQRVEQLSAETRALVEQLTAGVPEEPEARTAPQQAHWLLAQLLDWHRRDEKASWWEHYERLAKTDAELVDDREAIGEIIHLGRVGSKPRSDLHRYGFDGTQEHKLGPGRAVRDPRTDTGCGTVERVDDGGGIIELRRGNTVAGPHPRSLVPGPPAGSGAMRAALRRIATGVVERGVDGVGGHRAARDLLLRLPPRIAGATVGESLVSPGEDPGDACIRLVTGLDRSCLAVQGPPGAGKTYAGAQVIVDLVRRGRRVGVCATTHRAVGELLGAACRLARDRGVPLRALQKCEDSDACTDPLVQHTTTNPVVVRALAAGEIDVVAGTPWLLSRDELEGTLDVVVIDEAGQMSLANALASACAGHSLVLLGDPQQLAQPSQGVHPPGADVSALEHVLSGDETIAPDRGVFLGTTRRMHPEVTRFVSDAFYDGRLHAHPDCARQRVAGEGRLRGAGLRFVPVAHTDNRTWSPEEVVVVRDLVDDLLASHWTDMTGRTQPVTVADVLVVAPYNLQVRRLREALPEGARVGTVDKFQGQEAAVAIYAMATSSAEDVPRNLEFLFSRNRLNVAVSRARALAVVVCSPLLLHAGCRTPQQLRLVGSLCRFEAMAAGDPSTSRRGSSRKTPAAPSSTPGAASSA